MRYDQKQRRDLGMDGLPVKPAALRTVRSYQRQAIKARTKAELAFEAAVHRMVTTCRIHFVPQVIFYVTEGISFRADYVFRKYKLTIEIDGPSHHGRRERDAWRDRLIEEGAGYRTIRFTNEQVMNRPHEVELAVLDALMASPHGFKKLLHAYSREPYGPMPNVPAAQHRRHRRAEERKARKGFKPPSGIPSHLIAEAQAHLDRLAAERKR